MFKQLFARVMRFLVAKVIRPRWIVAIAPPEARGEMGILILGVPCYYKRDEPMYADYTWRLVRDEGIRLMVWPRLCNLDAPEGEAAVREIP